MSGWIKLEKDLANDPRVLKMASRLSHADVTLGSRSRLVVVGALVTLWWYADTHIGNDDVLAIGANEIDELVGLKGFSSLMPTDWLQILDADHVQLVGYVHHNGSVAKNRALSQKRQQRHRDKTTSTSRLRHALVTRDSLPDRDKTKTETETRPQEGERAARAREGEPEEVPRETKAIDCGSNLTRTAEEIFSSMLNDWKRDVPEANPEAFGRWIAHCETYGKQLHGAQRLAQARHLAGQGDYAAQAEIVDWCVMQGYRTLMPLGDVRARRDGMTRGKPEKKRWHPDDGDSTAAVG